MCSRRGKIAAAVLAGCLFFSGCTSAAQGDAMLLTERVNAGEKSDTATAVIGSVSREVYQSASVYNPSLVTVSCGEMAGATFVKMLVQKGDTIAVGDPVAEITVPYSQAELDGLYADLEIASLQYQSALASYASALSTAESTLASSVPGTPEYTLAKIGVERAQAEYDHYAVSGAYTVEELSEEISEFEARIETTTVNSPTDGVVTQVQIVSKNSTVSADTELCTVAKADTTYLAVPTTDGAMYRWGQEVRITNKLLPESGVTGHVVYAPDVEDAVSGTALVAIDDASVLDKIVNNLATNFVTGSYVLEGVLVVPTGAVTEEEDGYYTREGGHDTFVTTGRAYYVTVSEDGAAKKRYVTCGLSGRDPETGEGVVQILEGLHEGDRVIVE